jgi:hypothetical protein
MSGACGKRVGEVLKLFKKTLSLNRSSPSLIIGRKNECSCCGIDSGACTGVEEIERLKRKQIMYIQLTIIEKIKTF